MPKSSKKPAEHSSVNFKLPRYKKTGLFAEALNPVYYPGKEGRHPLLRFLTCAKVNGAPNPDYLGIESKFNAAIKHLETLTDKEKTADQKDTVQETATDEAAHLREIYNKFRAGTLDSAASLQELLAQIKRNQQTFHEEEAYQQQHQEERKKAYAQLEQDLYKQLSWQHLQQMYLHIHHNEPGGGNRIRTDGTLLPFLSNFLWTGAELDKLSEGQYLIQAGQWASDNSIFKELEQSIFAISAHLPRDAKGNIEGSITIDVTQVKEESRKKQVAKDAYYLGRLQGLQPGQIIFKGVSLDKKERDSIENKLDSYIKSTSNITADEPEQPEKFQITSDNTSPSEEDQRSLQLEVNPPEDGSINDEKNLTVEVNPPPSPVKESALANALNPPPKPAEPTGAFGTRPKKQQLADASEPQAESNTTGAFGTRPKKQQLADASEPQAESNTTGAFGNRLSH